ncbi:protein translocase subunit SecF [Limisalsivibrio acetivorans]|uniref:protein translocase subunit SecF n=1 Tax=Limisalsivibrio acetivorans TaxID=1304888 RepID=UPI0003B46401|nr:protein translocase subunit SecF [Limisalsivibrio acetivorans]
MLEIVKQGTRIDFLSKAKIFFAVSGALLVISLGLIFSKGFNYGIDFAGGTVIQASFENEPNLDEIRGSLGKLNLGDVVIQNFGNETDVLIRVERSSKELEEVSREIKNTLETNFKSNPFKIVRVEQVGPQVGEELKTKAGYAVLYALVGVLLYIAFRFQLNFSLGAVLAIFHDVIITLGIFSLMGREINLPIIAALLTIVGYSLNDTIVVFDRIRENMRGEDAEKMNLKDLMNKSLNETLSRTVLTSLTTLVAVLSLYLFGGAVINGFAFALLIGVIVGTYSSIGIASAFVYTIKTKKEAAA